MKIISNANLKDLAYYRTGGRCSLLYLPEKVEDVCEAVKEIKNLQLPYFILGAGSNSLVSDHFYEGAVINLKYLNKLELQNQSLYVEAGVDNSDFVLFCYEHSLGPSSWMFGLPGQIGGTTRMNARCYGGEISQIVQKVHIVDEYGNLKILDKENGIFKGYKDTIFMQNPWIIVAVEMSLKSVNPEEMYQHMHACKKDREQKLQYIHPSCGCIFKNDYSVGIPSGMLLDSSGVKSFEKPSLKINPMHANFLFNLGNASSDDILHFSFNMQDAVYKQFGVWLAYEMEVLGSLPDSLRKRFHQNQTHHINSEQQEKLNLLRKKFTT